jgi:hypothetical protein
MLTTGRSPQGSTSSSAPQDRSWKNPVVLVDYLIFDVHVVLGEAGVKLQLLEDGRDAVALDIHDLANPLGVDRARATPFLDRQLFHCLLAVAQSHRREHRPVEQLRDQRELTDEPDERFLGEVLVAEVRIEFT